MRNNTTKELQKEVAKKRESFVQGKLTVFEQLPIVQGIKKIYPKM